MPYLALLEVDLSGMVRSWIVRIWLGLMVAQALITIPVALSEESAAESVANLLRTYPLVWSTFAIIIISGAVSSEAGVVADSILSKAVTRYEYILAKMTSRLITVLGLYLLVVLPSAYLLSRRSPDGLTHAGIAWAILLVGMTLVLLTTLAVMLSTLLNRTLVAVIVVWFLWYVSGAVFALLELDHLSPLSIAENLPAVLAGTDVAADRWRVLAAFGVPAFLTVVIATLYFGRKDL